MTTLFTIEYAENSGTKGYVSTDILITGMDSVSGEGKIREESKRMHSDSKNPEDTAGVVGRSQRSYNPEAQ